MLKITREAKQAAKEALRFRDNLPKSKRFGLDKKQAGRLGINSGVERARQIMRQDYLNDYDARRVAAFYQRFKNKHGYRAEGSIGLWGGREFGRLAVKYVKGLK